MSFATSASIEHPTNISSCLEKRLLNPISKSFSDFLLSSVRVNSERSVDFGSIKKKILSIRNSELSPLATILSDME